MNNRTYNIAIIGFGPKGLYGFERLLAQIAHNRTSPQINIHLFDRSGFFGAGDVYRSDQPDYLLMNYADRNIDFRNCKEPVLDIPEIQNFENWSDSMGSTTSDPDVNRGDFSPRAQVGRYLMYCFSQLLCHLPDNVSVVTHCTTVVGFEQAGRGYIFDSQENIPELKNIAFDNILVTTGHFWNAPAPSKFSENPNYVSHIYPVDQRLGLIDSHSRVAVRGMGLTFIDAVLALTEGRGGTFEETADGYLTYCHSGKEPQKIYPFSRSGTPMIPRNGEADSDRPLRYFTLANILQDGASGKINFEEELLPIIIREMYVAYYETLFPKMGCALDILPDFQSVESQVNRFHQRFPNVERFDWHQLLHPFEKKSRLTHDAQRSYIQYLIEQAESGTDSPLMAAIEVWRKISPIFNSLYSFGGLEPESHENFDRSFFGLFNRLSYGPPVINMKKMLALSDFRLLDLSFSRNPTLEMDAVPGQFKLHLDEITIKVDYLINATIPKSIPRPKSGSRPKNGPRHQSNNLYANLLKNGIVQHYENKGSKSYSPGCIDLNIHGQPLDPEGNVRKNITFYGTPTEGLTFDNDTLSRNRNDFASKWAHDVLQNLRPELRKTNLKDEIKELS